MMALQAQALIVGWQVYSYTKDPLMLGLTGLFEALPAIICALFAGHVVDSSRPHRVYMLCIATLMVNTIMLWVVAGGILPLSHTQIVRYIFVGIFISGIARSFIMPASFALFPQIIERKYVAAASAWMGSGMQFAFITGPALAGLVYGGYGVSVAWLLPMVLMSMALLFIGSISHAPRQYKNALPRESTIKSITSGWMFIWNHPVLLSIMLLDMFAVMFGGVVVLLPMVADKILHVGSEGLGLLRSASAMGAMVIAILLAVKPMKVMRGSMLLAVVTGFGLCMMGFGMSHSFWLSMIFLALGGACDSISMIMRSTMMQLLVPETMRGRISAVGSMFIISSNELGAFESGLAARFLGLVPSIIFGGIGTLLVVLTTALCCRELRGVKIDTHKS